MKPNDLLDVIGEARDRYVLSAEQAGAKKAEPRHYFRKPMFLAAMLALAMVLAGCVAVFVGIQNRKIAQNVVTKRYDDYGKVIEPTQVTREVLSIHEGKDSPMQLAAKEWYEFLESYDPEHALMPNTNENNIPDNYYYTYDCYTQEMADKLDEIAGKHGLKLLDVYQMAQTWQVQTMFEGLGIGGVTTGGAQAEAKYFGSTFHTNGSFSADMELRLTAPNAAWTDTVSAQYQYEKHGYMAPWGTQVTQGAYEEWDYVTADGTQVLLVLERNGRGKIFAQQEDASIYISLMPDLPFVHQASENPTRKALEQMADVFDYRLKTTPVDMAVIQPKLDADEAAYQAAHTFEEPVYHNYGEYLNSLYWPEMYYYALKDLNADGQEELLLGWKEQDGFEQIMTIQSGKVENYLGYSFSGNTYLCENGEMMNIDKDNFSHRVDYQFRKLRKDEGTDYVNLTFQNGKWGFNPTGGTIDEEITEAEAKAIIAQYTPLDMSFSPILSYPMEGGGTLADCIRSNDPVYTEAELVKLYEQRIVEKQSSEYEHPTHYTIRDVNNDGILDLCYSEGPDGSLSVETVTRGELYPLMYQVYLCENGVIQGESPFFWEGNQRCDYYYFTMKGIEYTYIDYVRHDLSADTWGAWQDGPELTESEAQAIMAQYPRIPVELKPIADLIE